MLARDIPIIIQERDLPMNSQAHKRSTHRIAIDVGGTFVDYVLLDESTGAIKVEKQISTPERIVDEVAAGGKK